MNQTKFDYPIKQLSQLNCSKGPSSDYVYFACVVYSQRPRSGNLLQPIMFKGPAQGICCAASRYCFIGLAWAFCYNLHKLSSAYPNGSVGLYRDDGLAVFKNMNARSGDKSRKVFCQILDDLGLKITVQSNLKVVNYLDVTLFLKTGKYYPFRKPDNNPLYINAKSNHPPSIIKQVPASISSRISTLSCDANGFQNCTVVQ